MSDLEREIKKNDRLREKNKDLVYQVCKKYLRELKTPHPHLIPAQG